MNQTVVDDRYTLARPLGSGGMAEVFLAHDAVLDRDVALKILRGQFASDDEFAERFRREARSAARLSHPNIVQVYDRGEAPDGTSYIAMEYVSGGTLKDRLDERGPLEPPRALAVVAQIADALSAAHERGVVHRDIKPQNVLVTEMGHLKVTDFGIARAASSATISATNAVFGTAAYLSPEQALGQQVTPQSDLYSLGVVLYELLTGAVPYTADNPVVVCMKHVTEPLRPPRKIDPLIPSVVDALIVKMLAKDPADRPADATELLDDLERARAGIAPTPRPPTTAPTAAVTRAAAANTATKTKTAAPAEPPKRGVAAGRRSRRRRGLIAACAVAAVLLIGAVALALSAGPNDATPLTRVQGIAAGTLSAPTADAGGSEPVDPAPADPAPADPAPADPAPVDPAPPAATPEPTVASPPASPAPASPPASPPPDDGGPGSQYDGAG